MKELIKISITALFLFHHLLSSAQPTASPTGREMHNMCSNGDLGVMTCTFYIAGFRNGVDMEAYLLKRKPKLCLPADATNEQITMSYIKYLRDFPEHWHLPAPAIVYLMAASYFPC